MSGVGVGITLAQTNWFRNKTDFKVERATIGFLHKYVCFPAVRSAETLQNPGISLPGFCRHGVGLLRAILDLVSLQNRFPYPYCCQQNMGMGHYAICRSRLPYDNAVFMHVLCLRD